MKNKHTAAENTFLKQIGNNIIRNRKNVEISQEELAGKADIGRSYMGSIERGETNATILKMKKIADAIGVEVSELFKIKGK
jgi:transcriptional regulator with XRE-family HTH domain